MQTIVPERSCFVSRLFLFPYVGWAHSALVIEGQGRAILYTGDIRSEPWFVNNLKRNPFMIEYTSGLKTLDCIYLDTSNLTPIEFPTKAVGLAELLKKVAAYPKNTVFHLSSWTFGYEEVWMALSRTLRSRVCQTSRCQISTQICIDTRRQVQAEIVSTASGGV